MNIPKEATYYYQHTYYKLGDFYAMYHTPTGWKESGSITNQTIIKTGVPINARKISQNQN